MQLAIYKCSQEVERGYREQHQLVFRMGFEPTTYGFQIWRSNHSAVLPPRFFIMYENNKNKNSGMSFQNKFQINSHSSLVVSRHRMFSELVSDFLRAILMAPCISFVVYTLVFIWIYFLRMLQLFKNMLRMYLWLRAFFSRMYICYLLKINEIQLNLFGKIRHTLLYYLRMVNRIEK